MDIYSFLATGKLSPDIEVGNLIRHPGEVGELTEEHDGFSYYYRQPFSICLHGSKVVSIEALIRYDEIFIRNKQSLLKRGSNFFRTINLLNAEQIKWKFVQKLTFDDQICVRTSGGVDLLFGKDDMGKMSLSKIIIHDLSI